MKTHNIRKLVWTNYLMNIWPGLSGLVQIFFFFRQKKITVVAFFDSQSGNRKHYIFLGPMNQMLEHYSFNKIIFDEI